MISIALDTRVTARGSAVTVLGVLGELDIGTAPRLDEKVAQSIDGGATRIVIDVAGLEFCDASGLRVLMSARRRCVERQGWLRLVAGRRVRRLLELTDLLDVLPCHADLDHALATDDAPEAPAPGPATVTPIRRTPES
jgi:anti-sigma B factor antagonist